MIKKRKQYMSKHWILLEEYVDFPPLLAYEFISRRALFFKKIGAGFLDSVLLYNKGRAYSCVTKPSFKKNKNLLFRRLLAKPSWYGQLYQSSDHLAQQLQGQARQLLSLTKNKAYGVRLANSFRQSYNTYMDMALLGQPINIVEFQNSFFSNYLKKYLNKKFDKKNKKAIVSAYLILTNPSGGNSRQYNILMDSIDPQHQRFFRLARTIINSKQTRYKALLDYKKILVKVSALLGKQYGFPLKHLLSLTSQEAFLFLKSANKRNYQSTSFSTKLSGAVFYHGKAYRLTLSQVQVLCNKVTIIKADLRQVSGQGAVPGCVRGTVKVVKTRQDSAKVKKGDVVVSHATSVEITPALKRAAAIVSDIGGLTCHAAIISRELGIPCVIGTKVATRVFRDGDKVEVDAVKGVVKKI